MKCAPWHGTLSAALYIFCAGPRTAQADICELNLSEETADPGADYILIAAPILDEDTLAETVDIALCIAERTPSPSGFSAQPTAVGVIQPGMGGVCASRFSSRSCERCEWDQVDIVVTGHNIEIETYGSGVTCADTDGLRELVLSRRSDTISLADLIGTDAIPFSVYNTLDDSFIHVRSGGNTGYGESMDGAIYYCYMPTDDAHARFGLGYFYSFPYYLSTLGFYVCSDAVRICSFSSAIMNDAFNDIAVVGNSLNNSIALSQSPYGDARRYCDGTSYYVFGWSSAWEAALGIYGLDGSDYILGGLTDNWIHGGTGNDFIDGNKADPSRSVTVLGDSGRDNMHGGACYGGSPSTDYPCYEAPYEWTVWPNYGGDGDCCCDGCSPYGECVHSGLTPVPPIPVPW